MEVTLKQKSLNSLGLFIIYLLYYLLVIYFGNLLIYNRDFYFQALSNQLANERIQELLVQQKKFVFLGYLFFPIVFYLKIFLPTFCIYAGCYLFDLNIKWKEIFKIVLVAEIVFLLYTVGRFCYFLFYPPQSMEYVANFAPFSLYQLIGSHSPKYLQYILQTINIFEIAYWIVLAKGLQQLTKMSFGRNLGLLLKSYGIGLILWFVLVVFVQLQFS